MSVPYSRLIRGQECPRTLAGAPVVVGIHRSSNSGELEALEEFELGRFDQVEREIAMDAFLHGGAQGVDQVADHRLWGG